MKNGFLLILMISAFQLLPAKAHAQDNSTNPAGVVLFPSFALRQETGELAGDQAVFGFDFRAGYRIPVGFYFGMIYSSTTSAGNATINESAIGNSVGFFYNNVSLITSFFLYAQASESNPTASVTRSEGLGFQADLTVAFPIGSGFSIGPTFTYRNITYKIKDDGTNLTNSTQPASFFSPYLGVIFSF